MSDNSHAAMCVYCGQSIIYDTRVVTDMEAAHRHIVEHDQQCPMNPLVSKIKTLEQQRDRMKEALERSCVAIDDLLHGYAPEFCNEGRVLEAGIRVEAHGGTLAYLASVQEQNRAALKEASNE